MRKSAWMVVLAFALMVGLAVSASAQKAGKHEGEKKQLEVEIFFSQESGQTITTEEGTFFCFRGRIVYDDIVYPPEYRGMYPLYFLGDPVGVMVRVANKGPRAKIKLRVTLESYVLKTDGTNGGELMAPQEVEFELARGETMEVDGTFVVESTPDSASGLDRFVVKVSHPNQGGGAGNPDPALILVKEGIFCPPDVEAQVLAELAVE